MSTNAGPRSLFWRWRVRRGQIWATLAYPGLRKLLRLLQLSRKVDFQVHQIIAAAPWRLQLPPRLPHGLEVRELTAADVARLSRLRPANGMDYERRFAQAHRALGAFLDQRLVAFLWMRRGPALLPSAFGCSWQVTAPMAWLYDLYSDPEVIGAIAHLYAHLRQHPPGASCQQLVGQTDFDNVRSRLTHRRLGYQVCATLWSARCGGRWLHLSRGGGGWRWYGRDGLIPLHLFTQADPAACPPQAEAAARAPGGDAPLRLQCECGCEVALIGERYRCRCGRLLGRLDEGLLSLGDPIPYWGEIPQAQMHAVLERAAAAGWRAAVDELAPPPLRGYIAGRARSAFADLLPLPENARILDIGAGWGAIAAQLATRYRVVALEGVAERARFIQLRQRQDGLNRLTVINGNLHAAPLGLHQFDLIVANGVLEWAALLDRSASPEAVQLVFLHRLRELLAPGGMIYIGIENRCGRHALLGGLDHSGLPFTSLLPRPLARWVCAHSSGYRANFNTGYRTYTYTYRGYATLFARVGLSMRQCWVPTAGYNDPFKLVPLDTAAIRFAESLAPAPRGWRSRLRRRARQWGARAWVWRWLASDFAFLLAPASSAGARPPATDGAVEGRQITHHA